MFDANILQVILVLSTFEIHNYISLGCSATQENKYFGDILSLMY